MIGRMALAFFGAFGITVALGVLALPDPRTALLTTAVDNGPVEVTAVAQTADPSVTPPLVDEEAELLAGIDRLAAHPADPDNPPGVRGLSDAMLRARPTAEIEALISDCRAAAYAQSGTGRYLFALGRAAYLHQLTGPAGALLKEASQRGSAAASAYLALLQGTSPQSQELLRQSLAGGFVPAAAWLALEPAAAAPAQAVEEHVPLDYDQFRNPTYLRALAEGNVRVLYNAGLPAFNYLCGVAEGFADDQTLYLLDEQSRLKFRSLQRPEISERLGQRMFRNPEFIREASEVGMNTFTDALKGMVEVRRRGGSLSQEVAALGAAQQRSSAIAEQRTLGGHDGKTLALSVGAHYEEVKIIIENLESYATDGKAVHRPNLSMPGSKESVSTRYSPDEDYRRARAALKP